MLLKIKCQGWGFDSLRQRILEDRSVRHMPGVAARARPPLAALECIRESTTAILHPSHVLYRPRSITGQQCVGRQLRPMTYMPLE
jgi:hypothetical protein